MGLFNSNEDALALFENLRSVIGPGSIDEENIGGSPCYHVFGQYRAHPIHVRITTTAGVMLAVELGVSLGNRPITLLLNHRRNTRIHGVPEVLTGDPRFDALFLLNGFPDSVLRAALDPPTRSWLCEHYAERHPRLETEGGELRLGTVVQQRFRQVARVMPPAEIVYWLDIVLPIAERLMAAFDASVEQVATSHGRAAAEQWVRGHVDAMNARASRRRDLRRVLALAVVGALLVPALVVVLVVVGALVLNRPTRAPAKAVLDLMRPDATVSFQARARQSIRFRSNLLLGRERLSKRNARATHRQVLASTVQVTLVAPDGSERTLPCPFSGGGVAGGGSWEQDNTCAFSVDQSGAHSVRAAVEWSELPPESATLHVIVVDEEP